MTDRVQTRFHFPRPNQYSLTYWHLVTHMYMSANWVTIGSNNSFSPVRRQCITLAYAAFYSQLDLKEYTKKDNKNPYLLWIE